MQEPVPKGIVQEVAKDTRDLHETIAAQSTKADHPTTPAEVDPHDETLLDNIRQVLGSTIGEYVHGKESTTHVRTARSKSGLREIMSRVLKKAA